MLLDVPEALVLVTQISFGTVVLSLTLSLLLPSVPKPAALKVGQQSFGSYLRKIGTDLKSSFCNSQVLKWSIWWAFSTCMFFQVGNYIQLFWSEVDSLNTNDSLSQHYNGLTETINQLLGL